MMRPVAVVSLLLALLILSYGSPWVGQEWLGRRDSSADITAFIAIGRSNQPWAVWHGHSGDTTLMYSTWLGDRWDTEHGVGSDRPNLDSRPAPSLCFDGQNRTWVAWTNLWPNNTYDVASRFWDGDSWSREIQVNSRPDTECAMGPAIAFGGGQLWCVWDCFHDVSSTNYSVFASCWNEHSVVCGPQTRVSPPDGEMHWWNKVAVDQQGRPHVVWCTASLYTVFYSYYDGCQWVGPFPVNDTTRVLASWVAAPAIAIDREGILHVCFTGATRGAMYRDIFYSSNDGSGWRPCEKVSQDSIYDEWYSDIAADRPDNVWVVWDRQGEGSDDFRVYASRRDSSGWSPEERLDNDISRDDGYPHVALDTCGSPWVVWDAMPIGNGFDIFYNRYLVPNAARESRQANPIEGKCGLIARLASAHRVSFCYNLTLPGRVRLDVFDKTGRQVWSATESWRDPGQYATDWAGRCYSGKLAPAGIYFCRLVATGSEETCSFVLLQD